MSWNEIIFKVVVKNSVYLKYFHEANVKEYRNFFYTYYSSVLVAYHVNIIIHHSSRVFSFIESILSATRNKLIRFQTTELQTYPTCHFAVLS